MFEIRKFAFKSSIRFPQLCTLTIYFFLFDTAIFVNFYHRCDERFVGYGSNKAACLYDAFLSGKDFVVLPNDFVVHEYHKYPEELRTAEVYRFLF